METYKSFIKGNFLVLVSHILIYMQGIILIPLIIKSAGVTIYGGYILLTSGIEFIFAISSFGVGFRYKRFLPSARDIKSRCELFYPQLLFQIISIVVLSFVILLLGPFLSRWLLNNNIYFIILLAPILILSYVCYNQSLSYFRYSGKMNYYSLATVVTPYISIGIIFIILYLDLNLDVNLLISAKIISMLLIATPLFFLIYREIGFNIPAIKISSYKEDIKLGFPLVLGYITSVILSSSDRYVIALLLSVKAVGYYNPAYALGSVIIFFPMVSGVVLPPLLSKTVDTGREHEARVMLNYTIKGFLLLSIPFAAGSYVMGRQLLTLLANAEVGASAYLIVPVVAMGILFYGLNVIMSNILFVQMKTRVMFGMSVITAVLNLMLNIILIYIFRDIMMAALTTLLSYFIAFVFMHRIITSDWKIDFDLKVIMKSVASSVLMVIPLLWISSNLVTGAHQMLYVFGEILLGIMIYFATLFALRTFSNEELLFLKNTFLQWRT
jgi:O-antigen/teichoic acid export membrane protein